LSALVFFTTKPGHFFNTQWFLTFLSVSAITFALPTFLRAIWGTPQQVLRRAVLFGVGIAVVVGWIVSLGFAWAHRNYYYLETLGLGVFELIPPFFTLLPLSAGITIFIVCFRGRRSQADKVV